MVSKYDNESIDNHLFIDITKLSFENFKLLSNSNEKNRRNFLFPFLKKKFTPEEIKNTADMTIFEDLFVMLFLGFGTPGCAITIPLLVGIIGYFINSYQLSFMIACALLIPLAIIPSPYIEGSLQSKASYLILKYFSFKLLILESDCIIKDKPMILVAPPHGVFPYGNILTMLIFPAITGYTFKGLAASSALRTPIIKQQMCSIGVIDASRESSTKALNNNLTIGISTGGVAEVFETNSQPNEETIILKNRIGLIKLALRTGADLVPCYLFGNTELFTLFTGNKTSHSFLKKLSRKIGFAVIVFWGRFGLPIPYRKPVFGVMGYTIKVPKISQPTDEDIRVVHEKLLNDMNLVFEKYKGVYGWNHKQLIIE